MRHQKVHYKVVLVILIIVVSIFIIKMTCNINGMLMFVLNLHRDYFMVGECVRFLRLRCYSNVTLCKR